MNRNLTCLFPHKSLAQFLCDVLVEGILDCDVHQMQEFENESIFLKMPHYSSPPPPHGLFVCLHLPYLKPKSYLEQTNMPYCARA